MGVFGSMAKFLTSRTRQKPDEHARRPSEGRICILWDREAPTCLAAQAQPRLDQVDAERLGRHAAPLPRPSCQLLSSQTFTAWSILGFLTCLCSFSAVCMRLRHFINRPVGLRRPGPGISQVPTHLAALFVSLLPPCLCSPHFQLHDTITH